MFFICSAQTTRNDVMTFFVAVKSSGVGIFYYGVIPTSIFVHTFIYLKLNFPIILLNKKAAEAAFCFTIVTRSLKAEITHGYFSKVVCGITKRTRSISELDISVPCHEANDWFKSCWIKNNT